MFVDALPPQSPTLQELSPPAVSQPYDWSLSRVSFDSKVRKELLGVIDEAEKIRRLVSECAAISFERSIEGELRALTRHLSEPAEKRYFSAPERTLRELIGILGVVESTVRESFVLRIADLLSNRLPMENLSSKLDNICQYLTAEERGRIASKWLDDDFPGRGVCFDALLRSTPTAESLVALVADCGEIRLLSVGGPDISEILACAAISPILRKEYPRIEPGELQSSYAALSLDILQRIEECSASLYRGTDFCKTAVQALQNTFLRLQSWNEEVGVNRLMSLQKIAILEGRYCLAITESGGAFWTADTLGDLESVLSRLPESVVLHTPLLYEVKLNGSLPSSLYGVRYGSGVVEVAPHTAICPDLTQAYDGCRPLQVVLAHEIGHGIQLGKYAYQKGYLAETSGMGSCGDPRYDFGEFVSLSGWSLVSATKIEVVAGGKRVKIDDVEYDVGVEVEFRGERVIFSINQRRLYAFKAQARFSRDPYSRSDPWEDWAEAFSEYIFLPERLAKDAPGKFLFFEQEFNRYGMKSEVVKDAMGRE